MGHRCRGFLFGAARAGIKSSGLDVGVLVSERPASAAAVFTKNRLAAAPVLVSKARLARSGGVIRAVVVNSGNANACTGEQGKRDAKAMAIEAARALGLEPSSVLVASTGVIGAPLPMSKLAPGIRKASVEARAGRFNQFTQAILTTDRGPKSARRVIDKATLIGCTKGAGMIAPDMATTLTFVASDANVAPRDLHSVLLAAADTTFNAISVDGDTSTNDMILVMCNGANKQRRLRGAALTAFAAALEDLLSELARKLMRDGEGVRHVVEIVVRGAKSATAARMIAATIGNSPLVKTAIAGCDPNWGRILAAAGRAGVPLQANKLDLWIGNVNIARDGSAVATDVEARASRVMKKREYRLTLDLNQGAATASYLACDLTHEYVTINADYRT